MESTPEKYRKLLLRLRNLPLELVERTLIEVPLPQILEICSDVAGFANYCRDRNFWLSRAQARYGVRPSRFEWAETIRGTQQKLPSFSVYLSIILDFAKDPRSAVADRRQRAESELNDIETAVSRQLEHRAREKLHNTVEYYMLFLLEHHPDYDLPPEAQTIDLAGVDTDVIFPASSSEEAILEINAYLKGYNKDFLRTDITLTLNNFLNDIRNNPELDYSTDNLIDLLTDSVITSFREGFIVDLQIYDRLMPRWFREK